jgi:hypothetical protein
MQDYTRLLVWQRARSLNVSIAEIARAFLPEWRLGFALS